ncbi:MAG TPA: hypothetical protein VII82_10675 [Polyangiaceae bacterium]
MSLNRTTLKTRNIAIAAGIDKHVLSPILIGGVSYTPPTLKDVFAAQSAALDASDVLHTQWMDQVQAARDATEKANTVYNLLRSYLIGQYGTGANAILNDFGMTAPKPRGVTTVAVKAAAVAKGKATRVARHTMGKVQRKAVTGASVAAAAAPATTTPAAPQTPAPVAPVAAPAAPVKTVT